MVRRAATVMGLVAALARIVMADATVPAPSVKRPLCTMEDGPLRRAAASKLDQRARAAAGDSLWLSSVGERHLLMTTGYDAPVRTVVLDKSLTKVAAFEGQRAGGLVEREDGRLIGILAKERVRGDWADALLRLVTPSGKVLWTSEAMALFRADSLTTLVAGKLVVVAAFHRIATGARLFALDLRTGQRRWEADVVQLGVPHSQYWNDVALARDGTRVVMRGYEAGGCYEQVFDLATGRRLASSVPKQ